MKLPKAILERRKKKRRAMKRLRQQAKKELINALLQLPPRTATPSALRGV